MDKIYRVTFDTQRDRRYISWEYYVNANNQKEARSKAAEHWNSRNPKYGGKQKPHLFHATAKRVENTEKCLNTFYEVKNIRATWG